MRCLADDDDAGAQVLPDQGSSGRCFGRSCSRYLKRSAIIITIIAEILNKLLRKYQQLSNCYNILKVYISFYFYKKIIYYHI